MKVRGLHERISWNNEALGMCVNVEGVPLLSIRDGR